MKALRISDHLALPLDAVTQTIGILAKRRAGKSFAARRLTEQFVRAGLQVVIVDPKGDWWGIRSAANGKDAGLPIVILGGERGDVKLEPSAGEVVAKLVVEERVSVLLDLSLLRKHEVATFMATFLEQLYRLKAREEFREPLMLMVDEADAIAPQSPKRQGAQGGNVERMLGAAEDIVRRGGQRGIGCTLITQRSAVLNKNVLTQIQILIALRTIAPQDLAALNEWVDVHGTQAQRKTLMESLPALPVGDAWVWSPGWPTDEGIFQRVHVLPIETFDSGSTPKPGVKRKEPRALAKVDLAALERQMAETIERSKAEDPRELQKTIRDLRAQLAKKEQVLAEVDVRTKRIEAGLDRAKPPRVVEKPVLKDAQIKRLEAAINRTERVVVAHGEALEKHRKELEARLVDYRHQVLEIKAVLAAARTPSTGEVRHAVTTTQQGAGGAGHRIGAPAASRPAPALSRPQRTATDHQVSRPQQQILDAIAYFESVGVPTPSRRQVALVAKVSAVSSGYDKNVSTLRTAGLIDYPAGNRLQLTSEGVKQAQAPAEPPSQVELHDAIRARVSRPQAELLRVLIKAYPSPMPRAAAATESNQSETSSGFDKNVSTLRTLGLIDYPGPGQLVASPVLFLEGA